MNSFVLSCLGSKGESICTLTINYDISCKDFFFFFRYSLSDEGISLRFSGSQPGVGFYLIRMFTDVQRYFLVIATKQSGASGSKIYCNAQLQFATTNDYLIQNVRFP